MEGEERKKGNNNNSNNSNNSSDDKDKGGAQNPKRKMKTPSQLEILERVYAEDRYPSEVVRAELSTKLNLTDRQLQMWFCHRRLKDRKGDESTNNNSNNSTNNTMSTPSSGAPKKQKKEKATPKKESALAAGGSVASSANPDAAVIPSDAQPDSSHAAAPPVPGSSLAPNNVGSNVAPKSGRREGKRKGQAAQNQQQQQQQQTELQRIQHAELAAIRLVEAQLGEPLREDGPLLGCEFDPLPPGAFDTPIEPTDQRMYSLEPASRVELKVEFPSMLASRRMSPQTASRIPREHQFIPEHPTAGQLHERSSVPKSERGEGGGKGKSQIVGGTSPLMDGRVANLSLNFFPPGGDADGDNDEPPPLPQASGRGYVDVEKPAVPEAVAPPTTGSSKKRKSEDARLAKELEAQEKKLKKEAEKQEAARRKREEQERKEIEKINRERQKELEKINRERQREEERQQREQKKEHDRLEKLAQKEQQRLEKLRLKEEMRRQKEAAKLQAAYERATAKRLAKLSTGLIDDEQLELMQMGAFVQGMVSGDMEGGAGFDPSKIELKKYPPASVRMKKVLGIPPWDSVHNVANLFMVWRFLTTFSDAIGLWPFTVDEFVQGLHDFDSRLLNETYIALLKTLIKDVEDAAQAAASGTAGSQHAIAVAAGGHPQIVEAAYTWGFDIQEWGQHMSPLTWPEILRQFALAAGYGPRWKKRSPSTESKPDYVELNDGHNANAIATLRSGAAAVNAVALMRGKNASRVKLRKGQSPKLTPGTVKYAAFHVLSLEGSKGLTILELTDRIQKSGLRDLSSSKTPEASISAALSRDTHLFERVAPSTYCVRSPFRRDTEEAEEVLQAALERTYLYQTRHMDPDKADEDAEDGEEESDGEEDEAEAEAEGDAEAEQEAEMETEQQEPEHESDQPEPLPTQGTPTPTPTTPPKVILRLKAPKMQQISVASEEKQNSAVQGECSTWSAETVTVDPRKSEFQPEVKSEVIGDDEPKPSKPRPMELERKFEQQDDEMEIDESQVGEPWVQGLMEGEFADLSIEERLNALVALVDVLNEGNTIRSVLEERYESASALKRQLWEEVQVDKRRLKEELTKSGGKAEAQDEERPSGANTDFENVASTSNSDKSRAQMKAEIRLRAEKLYVIRSLPLGMDRRYNRYWQFAASHGGEDPGRARIYFECNADGHWEVIDTEEALDALMASLDTRGVRESSLYNILNHIGGPLKKSMKLLAHNRVMDSAKSEGSPSSGVCGPSDVSEVSSAISVELGRSKMEIQHAMERFKDLDRWVWNRCLAKGEKSLKALTLGKKRDVEMLVSCDACHGLFWPKEKHCSLCHAVVECKNDPKSYAQHVRECEESLSSDGVASQVLPSRLQLLKHLLLAVEVAIPADAFKSIWTSTTRKDWCDAVKVASSPSELLQAFTELESSVDEQWISSSYETAEKALSSTIGISNAKNLPWVPQTTGAISLRLSAFDAAIAFNPEQRQQMEETHQQEDHHDQQTDSGVHAADPARANVHEESPEGGSSPDSDLPPDFQNGHARLPGRSTRGGHSSNFASRRAQNQHQQQHQQQQQQSKWKSRGRGRLSFRFQGRFVAGSDGGNVGEDHHGNFQRQEQHEESSEEEEDEEGVAWERHSDETEHSYDEEQEQQHEEEQGRFYQQGEHEQDDQQRSFQHQQYHDNQQQNRDNQNESEDEEDEEEDEQGVGAEYEEYDEYGQHDHQGQEQGHHLHHRNNDEGMMEDEVEVEEEVEEVDEDEDLSDESS